MTARRAAALLALEDGTTLRGTSFGADGETFGEAVFNTGMAGYQEVLTDPSYAGQIVTMTSPHQGNYGLNALDPESGRVQVAGFAVREASRRASSWRAERTLHEELAAAGVVGIEGIDTRRLTLRLREHGSMRAACRPTDLDAERLVARVREAPGMEGADLAASVSASEPFEASTLAGPATTDAGRVLRVAAVDFGMKRNILRRLAASGVEATVFPATTPPSTISAGGFDGVFLSNGPGDPAATAYGIRTARELLGAIPIFGICLGTPAARARARRAHVQDEVRSPRREPARATPADRHRRDHQPQPRVRRRPRLLASRGAPGADHRRPADLTHWNLNDGTLEGLRCLDVPAFSVQYHPEAAPGPHDSRYLFAEFRALMEGAA